MTVRNKFSFYASYYEMLADMTDAEQLDFLKSVIEYALLDKEPQIKGALRACFTGIRPNIDNDKNRYDTNVRNGKQGGAPQGNKNASSDIANNPKQPIGNPKQPKTTQNNPPTTENKAEKRKENAEQRTQNVEHRERNAEQTRAQAREDFSLSQIKFKKAFEGKAIDCEIPQNYDIDALINAINQSNFLKNSDNLSLKWCIDRDAKILKGDYKNHTNAPKPDPKALRKRKYTEQELDSIVNDFKDIEI